MFNLFIVEDEWLVREGLKQTIPWDEVNCQIIGEASDGLHALELLQSHAPDILLTDIRMPAMNGIELAEQAVKLYPHLKIVFLTGFDDFSYAQKAVKLGAADFVLKPTNPEELVQVFTRITNQLVGERKVLAEAGEWNRIHKSVLESRENSGFKEIEQFIKEKYGEDITLQSMADRYNMSESYFSRLFKKQIGVSFMDYLTDLRVNHAKELLLNPRLKIYQIAIQVGYQDSRYFSQVFRKYTGETPTEFRKRYGIEVLPL
ncbi:response regulator transcription factor [Paenibacillus radicis (ex Xue et al. 2023)]|uniref:Response regulator n=1 Tax=Paenibacillus radicis (ex Xue et al. 2023) TaxID=2972489 RepID=A0ABT1YJ24_9BACL|nr:helix-turn-helix domain-containing protein [Paenibacillus radicis (ex Xue et al. 2023)]MCR8632967.1 response regulator [Paenibacillus radicis (ex Xue et al. 2023)]